jgi:hypothetical protein
VLGTTLLALLGFTAACHAQTACQHCGWKATTTPRAVSVKTTAELERAVFNALEGTTILVQDGTYRLNRMLDLAKSNLVLRGQSGDRTKVILRGEGMHESKVGVAVSISASNIIVADMTIGNVGYHGVQVRGEKGVHRVVLHNLQVQDTGQQLVKGSVGNNGQFSESVLVACSSFEYADHALSDYTNGVDVLGGRRWTVRDNRFRNIRGPQERNYAAGPAILFWRDCRDTLIASNIVVDCFRGISLGLVPGGTKPAASGETYYDHQRGMVCNNVVCNLQPWGDEGIEANAAKDARIEHNTVLVEGTLPWSIGIRFPSCNALVRNNLTNRSILERDAAHMIAKGNVTDARRSWFLDAAAGDLRLAEGTSHAIDAGVEIAPDAAIPELASDLAGKLRAPGSKPDAGAFEYSADRAK